MSFSNSRKGAIQDAVTGKKGVTHAADPDAEGAGLRDWFHGLPRPPKGSRAAAFDTRLASPMAGGAAKGIARRLHGHGYDIVVTPEGFIVEDAYGPVRAGELERARAWGDLLVTLSVPVG
jgi:hypothetical protein